jgi:4-hydroxy-3-polyprenylbenzoate decarboxylase
MSQQRYANLSEFIAFLESKDELARITTPVSCELEITEITDRVTKQGGPALLFENVEGYSIPVVTNLFGSQQRMAWGLGVDHLNDLSEKIRSLLNLAKSPPKGITEKAKALGELVKMARYQPKLVGKAPCQEVIYTGDDVDLNKLPILKCWPLDAGRYITLPLVITKDPDTGGRNVGMYRIQVFDSKTTGMHWQTHKVGTKHQRTAQEKGLERIDVAVAIGGDPTTIWSGSAPLPPDLDEFVVAGILREQAVEVVKAKTVDLEVPANAEFIIEGYVDVNEKRMEGPFGDHTGYYSLAEEYPVLHVTAITSRKQPIYPTTIVGRPIQEDYFMGKATERLFLPIIQTLMPEVIDMNMPAEGVFHNLVIVSVKKDYPGQAQKVMYGLWGMGLMALAKAIIVVDHFVNVQDISEVAWRVTNNIDPARDILMARGPVDDLDHASIEPKYGSKVGIDATAKQSSGESSREWPPDIVMEKLIKDLVDKKWDDYGI